ncbi:MAG TPA: GMP/IMP nucleotidase [Steroidobacteraceae bacterium]|jgi:HAD superfamily hydrolase (TIGR01509 family)|nr:GMP/IMP nucleotidase [Steroidobacteraceae bacterium]
MSHPDPPDWPSIDTVLLDLDGTLLDLAFDTRFWRQVIPSAWARAQGISVAQARALLAPRFSAREGTLDWYSVVFWSRELELDVAALKREVMHEVRWLSGVPQFLATLRRNGKRLVLLTNAHPQTLAIKDECIGVSRYLDAMFSSHTFSWPKEDPRFWESIRRSEPYDPQRSLFVDDSPPVLAAARAAGIRWVIGLRHPDSQGTVRDHGPWPAVDRLTDLAGPDSGLL